MKFQLIKTRATGDVNRSLCAAVWPCITTLLLTLSSLGFAQVEGGQFRIISTPPGAVVTLNGESMGQTPLALTGVSPGEHLLVIDKPDYKVIRRTLTVGSNDREIIEVSLKKLTGFVVIHSQPSGADVRINNASIGTTPVLITDLPFGSHRVSLSKSGSLPKDVDVKVESRVPVKKLITLTSNTATLELSSTPTGAQVLLNGADRGFTPVTLEGIPAGKVELQISEQGYQSYKQDIVLDVGQTEAIRAVLTAIPGTLQIVTVPPDARIYIDDVFRGMSPLLLENLAPDEYRVRAEKEGFDDRTRSVTVPIAASVVEELRLTQISGALEITTEPSGVSVLVDGVLLGVSEAGTNATDRVSSPLRISFIEEGDHALQLTKVGYFPTESEIQIERRETLTMHFALKRRFIPNYEVLTNTGLVIGMFHEIDGDGAVRLEVSPGVIKTIKKSDIRLRRALRGENIPPPETD